MTSSYAAILPGARVRNGEGFIGTVEGLRHAGTDAGIQPDSMIVRAEDGRWRYTLPLFLVSEVRQEPLHPLVHVGIASDELIHYISEEVTQPGSGGEAASATITADDRSLRVPVLEEEIVARKVPTVMGSIHIHKGIKKEKREMKVPLHREKTVVEHIPPDKFDASAPTSPNEIIIPVVEEELIVQKRTVVKEYLRVRKEIVTEDKTVRGEVRRAVVEVSEQPRKGEAPDASGEPLPQGETGQPQTTTSQA